MKLRRALNQKTCAHLPFEAFLDLAAAIGCEGVEPRNDLGRPLFDGLSPSQAAAACGSRGLKILGLSEVYAFNDWPGRAGQVEALAAIAAECGAAGFSLIPSVEGHGGPDRIAGVQRSLAGILPILDRFGATAFLEPIGFASSTLRDPNEAVEILDRIGAGDRIRLVHDTFQNVIAGAPPPVFARTGMVHLSGVDDPATPLAAEGDGARILVGPADRIDNLGQVRAFLAAGYTGPFSFECTDPSVLGMADPGPAIAASFAHIEAALAG